MIAAALLLAVAVPAAAQTRGEAGSRYGFDAPAGTPLTPHGQGGAGAIPPVEGQYDAAWQAGAATGGSIDLLRAADRALEANNPGVANEHLERAATALLNQPGIEARPEGVRSIGPGRAINEARAALAKDDVAAARRSIQAAMAAIRRADGGQSSGAEAAVPAGSSAGR